MKKEKIIILVLAIAVLLTAMFVFSNSIKGPEESGKESGFVSSLIEPLFNTLFGEDHGIDVHYLVRKAGHLTEFCILGILAFCLAKKLSKKFGYSVFGYLLFGVLAVGVTDEFIQSFTGRGTSVSDVLIDFTGAIIGFLLTVAFCAIKGSIQKRKEQKNNETDS